jgi:anti-sigma regulatory factor (Ser/Thr protein kinase)
MEPKDRCDVEVKMSAAAAAPACARNAVARWLRGRVRDAVLEDAVLLVSELVTNSARHAITPSGATISVRGTLDDRIVRVRVLDQGRQGAVAAREPGDDGCGGHGGYGLQLVASLATDWGVRHDRGTEVWFELPAAGEIANGG